MKTVSTARLLDMKRAGDKIASLTAYDASFARLLDDAGVDVVLVGDSLGMVIQGHDTTMPVRLSDMIYHSSLVRRGVQRALVVTDMPFMSYATPEQALGNAGRLLSEGGAQLVKLEGGAWLVPTVELLNARGIAVCGHLGLTPQSLHNLGGYRVQGRDPEGAARILDDAQALQAAGAKMLVLECVPETLAAEISRVLTIPVIGIGASVDCDGQVLVLYDMLGINPSPPRFAKNFLATATGIDAAIRDFIRAVKAREFPGAEHTFA
jgi:3-methyl-2-oxobutanoate hydroxymethyltransferase